MSSRVFLQFICAPIAEVKGRIGHDEISLQRGVLIVKERVGIALAKIGLQATNGYIHVGHLPSGGIRLLTIDADIVNVFMMVMDKLGTLHKHTA